MLETVHYIDKYKLCEPLRQGNIVQVWKAEDHSLRRPVIIKLLKPEHLTHAGCLQRFQQHARMLVRLNHPNIIPVYDVSWESTATTHRDDDTLPHIVVPSLAGPSLADYIARTSHVGKFPSTKELLQLFIALGSAIDYAHAQGVTSLDLQPAHILLDRRSLMYTTGEPLLTDEIFLPPVFTSYASRPCAERLTDSSSYRAPEQVLGKAGSQQSEVYSLGVMLYELCTGKLPFDPPDASVHKHMAILLQSLKIGPAAPSVLNPDISPELEAVIVRSIARRAEQRFPDLRSMLLALVHALDVPLSPSLFVAYHSAFLASLQRQEAASQRHLTTRRPESARKAAVSSSEWHKSSSMSSDCRCLGDGVQRSSKGSVQAERKPGQRQKVSPAVHNKLRAQGRRHGSRGKLIVPSLIPLVLIATVLFLTLDRGPIFSYGRTNNSMAAGISEATIGQVRFLNSGQGINDEVRVDLTHLADPAPGKSDYAWLLADANQSDAKALLLGRLQIAHGSAHLQYMDPQHSNLLVAMSRFLVTEEETTPPPVIPSPDQTTWRASGEITQIPNPRDQNRYSFLDHLRHLLAADPELEKDPGLRGGLSTWLLRNTAQVQQLAQGAQKSYNRHDASRLRSQIISLLDYLDGTRYVAPDLPEGTPILVNAPQAQIGLLQLHAYQPGYLYHVGLHLLGLTSSPGTTASQQKIAAELVTEMNTVQSTLEQVREIARNLATMKPDQLLRSERKTALMVLVQQAQMAYEGQQDHTHGVQGMCTQMASLATIDVKATA